MALVDLRTGKIIGAKEGTLKYLHEEGHIEFNNSTKGIKLNYWQSVLQDLTTTFVIMAILFLQIYKEAGIAVLCFSGFSWLLYLFLQQYEERWCWNYAKKKMKGGLNNARTKS